MHWKVVLFCYDCGRRQGKAGKAECHYLGIKVAHVAIHFATRNYYANERGAQDTYSLPVKVLTARPQAS